jgi:hypothetical protein
MMLRPILFAALAFCLGALLGPILVAAGTSLSAPSGASERAVAAHQLLRTFDEHFPQPIPQTSFVLDAVANDCGYDADRLFEPADELAEGQDWTPRTGYFDLVMWLSEEFRRETERRRAHQLEQRMSAFEIAFYNKCMTQTALANLCGARVRQVLEEGHLVSRYSLPSSQPRLDQSRQMKTVCTYLAGLAARKRLPSQTPH